MSRMTYDELQCYCKWLTDRYNTLEQRKDDAFSEMEQQKNLEIKGLLSTIKDLKGQVKTLKHNFSNLSEQYSAEKKEAIRESLKEERFLRLQKTMNEQDRKIKSLQAALSEMAVAAVKNKQ